MRGWIKLHRCIADFPMHPKQETRAFTKFEAFLDILLSVNHEKRKFILGSEIVECKPGETVTSETKLAARWSWSRTKVRSFLSVLKKNGTIEHKTDGKKTRVFVINWREYQVEGTEEEQETEHKTDNKKTKEKHKQEGKQGKENKKREHPTQKIFDSLISKDKTYNDFIEKFIENKRFSFLSEEEIEGQIEEFCKTYLAKSPQGKKFHWQKQQTFDIYKRFDTWLCKAIDWGHIGKTKKGDPKDKKALRECLNDLVGKEQQEFEKFIQDIPPDELTRERLFSEKDKLLFGKLRGYQHSSRHDEYEACIKELKEIQEAQGGPGMPRRIFKQVHDKYFIKS